MRTRLAAIPAAVAVASLTLLAGCGSSGAPNGTNTSVPGTVAESKALAGLTATGPVDLKTAPTVTFPKSPVSSKAVERKVLTPGSGKVATAADVVGVRLRIYNGTSGKLLDDGYAQGRKAEGYRLARKDLIAGFTEGLVGAQQGGRMAFTIPPEKGFGPNGNAQLGVAGTDTIVVVADVADVHTPLKQVDGTPTPSPAGMPSVEFADGPLKEPKVIVSRSAAPGETQQATLIEGTGKVVEKGQTLYAHYHGVLWKDASVFDSSWKRGEAADFPIGVGGVIKGWDNTLVGKKVGSRVLIAIPPKDGYGEAGSPPKISGKDTLVFIVDILDAY